MKRPQARKSLSRSDFMSRIRSSDTQPELILRRALWSTGQRYRLNLKIEGVRPDIVFPAERMVVFVDGCFWHGCPSHYVRPRNRQQFWASKLSSNVARDRRQTALLRDAGWKVVRLWEHDIRSDSASAAKRVTEARFDRNGVFAQRTVVVAVDEHGKLGHELWYLADLTTPNKLLIEVRRRSPVALTPHRKEHDPDP